MSYRDVGNDSNDRYDLGFNITIAKLMQHNSFIGEFPTGCSLLDPVVLIL